MNMITSRPRLRAPVERCRLCSPESLASCISVSIGFFANEGCPMQLVRLLFFFSSRRRHTRLTCDWSSDVCSSDLGGDERTQSLSAVMLEAHLGSVADRTPLPERFPLPLTTVSEFAARSVAASRAG